MSNPLDKIADAIANAIISPGVEETPVEIIKPLPPSTESEGTLAVNLGRGFGDLQRFILPQIVSPESNAVCEGSSSLALKYLARQAQDSIKVSFPDLVYGIWLDPYWTSPGAQIGIAYSGASRGNFFVLTPGHGVRFTTPVREIRIINADGMEQITGNIFGLQYPTGYLSFLVAISKEACWNGDIPRGHSNVSQEIQFLSTPLPLAGPTEHPTNGAHAGMVATQALSGISIDVQLDSAANAVALGGFAVTFSIWKMSAFQTTFIPFGAGRNIDVFSDSFAGRWVKDRVLTGSCFRNVADNTNTGLTLNYKVPRGAFACLIQPDSVILDGVSNAVTLRASISGADR